MFSLMFFIRIFLATLVIVSCLLGDNFVETTRHPLLRALVDNATHAVIGALTGIVFVVQFYDKISNVFGWLLILTCFVTSSLIDVDHFIEARSLSLEDATSLLHRPFLHCSTIPLILLFAFIFATFFNYIKISLFLGSFCCAFFTHHIRDAIRRGFWFCPYGHTDRLPQLQYIILTVATPYIIYYVFLICRSAVTQHFLKNYLKLSYDVPVGIYRAPIV